jgi:SAM-dependent methyltransferase
MRDVWAEGNAYEAYMGRWSRRVAAVFVPRLDVPPGRRWLDVGCGTGSLTAAALALADPSMVVGVDPSTGFLAAAPADERAAFCAGDARSLPFRDRSFDAVVSGLALNFVPDPVAAASELVRVAVPGGTVAAFVWDYADGMGMLRYFWDAASALDPAVASRDEGGRFPLCRPDPLRALWRGAGVRAVAVDAVEVPTVFATFDDYWRPFLGGQGPAPGHVASLADDQRAALRELVRARLPTQRDGSIRLTARAWAVYGTAGPRANRSTSSATGTLVLWPHHRR